MVHNPLYLLGCPVWSCPQWRGSVYRLRAKRADWLQQYSQVFNSVEGNSTFYGIPAIDTFARWGQETAEGFRFCLKFPRAVSHESELELGNQKLDLFLAGVNRLHRDEKLGPTFLQLSPTFAPEKFNRLASFLHHLPREYPYAVEVRHPAWFEQPAEQKLNQLLSSLDIDRVIFDSRPLFSSPPADEIEAASQQRKPRVPIRTRLTGNSPMLRLVGKNNLADPHVLESIEHWTEVVALWIESGHRPIVFTHAPDDRFAPEFARAFHNRLAQRVHSLQPFESWPMAADRQQSLF